jgi:pimeloyl-ACP methyl ester carboxylesterase
VLVHGAFLGGRHAWREQRSLGERWELIAPDRPGHGETPSKRQDFEQESVELANQLLTQPVHLVGVSYGAIVAMLAAVRAATNVVSLTIIEPPFTSVACGGPVVDDFADAVRAVIDDADAAPGPFLRRFCEVVGVPAHVLPDPPLRVLVKGVRQLQGARPPDEAMLPPTISRQAGSRCSSSPADTTRPPRSSATPSPGEPADCARCALAWGTWSKTRVRPSMHCWRASVNQPKPTGPQRWEVAHHDRSSAHC